MTHLEVYIDGASRGNPGPSGIGYIMYRAGKPVKKISRFIGMATNNVAEYSALIAALEEARRMKADSLTVKSDSQLLCRQLDRKYKVRNESIASLFVRAHNLLADFTKVSVVNVPREQNKEADKLAGDAVKDHLQRAGSDCPGASAGHPALKDGSVCAAAQGRKVRAPEDNALCNTELPPNQATFGF